MRLRLLCCLALLASVSLILVDNSLFGGDSTIEVVASCPHKEPVYAVAFSPDGSLLATAGLDGVVKLWDPLSGVERANFSGKQAHQKMVLCVAFSPDGKMLASGSADNTVKVWTVPTGDPEPKDPKKGPDDVKPSRNFGLPNLVHAIAFHPDGKKLAVACHDGHIRIYELEKNAQIRDINAHALQNATMIYALVFTHDGKNILSAGYDTSLTMFNVDDGKLVREFPGYSPPPGKLDKDKKGKDAKKEFADGHHEPVLCAAFSADDKLLASGSGGQERCIKIWNVEDGKVIRDLANPAYKKMPTPPPQALPGAVNGLQFMKEGRLLSVGDAPLNKGYVAVWKIEDGSLQSQATLPWGAFNGVALSPDQTLAAIAAGSKATVAPDLNRAYVIRLP